MIAYVIYDCRKIIPKFSCLKTLLGLSTAEAAEACGAQSTVVFFFCLGCWNGLTMEEGQHCPYFMHTCPCMHNITCKVTNQKYPKLKEMEDVPGEQLPGSTLTLLQSHVLNVNILVPVSRSSDPLCGRANATFYKCCDAQCGHS